MHLKRVHIRTEKAPSADSYPFNLPVLGKTGRIDFIAPLTFFVGENGTGKSTLLQALARCSRIHIWHEAGRRRFRNNPYEERLHEFLAIDWVEGPVAGSYFDSEISRHFAVFLDEWAAADPGMLEYFGGKSLMEQSHGQSLMAYFRSRYRIRGLYMLDEPETALSPASLLELVRVLRQAAEGGQAQFIIATHSPILLACPGATIYSFDHAPLRSIGYRETTHYRIYRDFMADPDAFVGEGDG